MTMISMTSAGTPATVLGKERTVVYVKKTWEGSWEIAKYIEALTANETVAPGMDSASLLYHYGSIKREDSTSSFSSESPKDYMDYYVKFSVAKGDSDYSDPATWWVGKINDIDYSLDGTASGSVSGVQNMRALGLGHMLDRKPIEGAFCKKVDAKIEIDWSPTFNKNTGYGSNVFGNRSATVGPDDVFLFGDDWDTNTEWTYKDILDYILEYYQPGGPTFVLGGQLDPLSDAKGVVWCEGMTVWQILNQLINYSRGLTFKIETTGEGDVTINVVSIVGEPISVGDYTFPANPSINTLQASSEIWTSGAFLRKSTAKKYNKIVVSGKRVVSCFTLSVAEENIETGWTTDEEVAYDAENDDERETDKHERVYNRFRVPKDWDWKAGDGFGDKQTVCSPTVKKDGTLDKETNADEYMFDRKFLSWIPFEKPVNGTDGTKEPEYLEPCVWVENPMFDGLATVQWRYVQVDKWKFPIGVRMLDRELGFQMSGQYKHMLALNSFDNEAAPASSFIPMFDYNDLIATVAVETSQRLQVIEEIKDNDTAEEDRVLAITDMSAELWYVVKGTRKPTADDRMEKTTEGEAVRDDSPRLRKIAAFAKAWYALPRAGVSYSERVLAYVGFAGKYLATIKSDTQEEPVNTIISAVSWDFRSGTSTVYTSYMELNFKAMAGLGGEVDIPGMSDGRSIAKKFKHLDDELKEIQKKVGALPNRFATLPGEIVTDDKYVDGSVINTSKPIIRECDRVHGHMHDHELVVYDLGGTPRVAWHINDGWSSEGSTTGGWMAFWVDPTTAVYSRDDQTAPSENIGQVGYIIIIPIDSHLLLGTNADGNNVYIPVIRHDAHRYYDDAHHGRHYYDTNIIGVEETGRYLWGRFAFDHAIPDIDGTVLHETGEWRPWIPLPPMNYTPVTTVPIPWTPCPNGNPLPWPGAGGGGVVPGGGFGVPDSSYLDGLAALGFPSDYPRPVHGQGQVVPAPLIDPIKNPTVCNPAILVGDTASETGTAVFRYTCRLYRDNDYTIAPSIIRYGRIEIPITADSSYQLQTIGNVNFDGRDLKLGGIFAFDCWRDVDDQMDDYGGILYVKEPLIGGCDPFLSYSTWQAIVEDDTDEDADIDFQMAAGIQGG